jgi:predicted DNA-binding transcriptional regulator AlpA
MLGDPAVPVADAPPPPAPPPADALAAILAELREIRDALRAGAAELVGADAAAAMAGVSPATWWRWDAARRCPAPLRLTRGVTRWRRAELAEWIAAGCPPRREWDARRAR